MTRSLQLLLCSLATAASSLSAPAMPRKISPVKGFVAGLRVSAKKVVSDQKACMALRKRKKAGEVLDFDGFFTLQQGNSDLGRIVNVAWLGYYFKQWTPLAIVAAMKYEWFPFPLTLPTPFETEALRLRAWNKSANARNKALRGLVLKCESSKDAALLEVGTSALRRSTKLAALKTLLKSGAGFEKVNMLPDAVVYAASAACEGPFRVFPRFLHCNAIEGKLKSIVDGDVALRKSNLSRLQRRAIEGACVERAIPVAERSEVMVKGLDEWLALTKSQPAASDSSVCLALLAINTAHVIRRDDSSRLTRSLLSPNGF